MTVDAVNVRCSEIEQTWQAASASGHLGYLDELAEMAGALEQMTGSQAATSTRSRTVLTTSPKPEGQPLQRNDFRGAAVAGRRTRSRGNEATIG